jgi:hypothetical protein
MYVRINGIGNIRKEDIWNWILHWDWNYLVREWFIKWVKYILNEQDYLQLLNLDLSLKKEWN